MSFKYAESNDELTMELFLKRSIYRGSVLKAALSQGSNLTDFNRGEKYFYGRVDTLYNPITVSNGISLKALDSAFSKESGLQVLIFVAEAFEAMARQFDKCALMGLIDPNDPFLSKLRAFKAYTDPRKLYQQHIQLHFTAIEAALMEKNIVIENFDDFVKELQILLEKSAHSIPFTQTAYMKSKYCSVLANGLTIEIADLDVANDEEKISQFINSPNWAFYLNACNSYGFMVDQAIPWRIMGDIASSPILEHAANHGVGSTPSILGRAYLHTHQIYYPKFKFWLLQLYNKVASRGTVLIEDCQGRAKSKVVESQKYTAESLQRKYPESYFLELYCKIRFLEEESKFSDFEKNDLIDDAVELHLTTSTADALTKFERIINKPFDYRGSLSYTKVYQQARSAAEEP
tara:strand:+ start:5422 stop:6633 length:1212 start_codon:yes stop_codon:yes gene_type:complete